MICCKVKRRCNAAKFLIVGKDLPIRPLLREGVSGERKAGIGLKTPAGGDHLLNRLWKGVSGSRNWGVGLKKLGCRAIKTPTLDLHQPGGFG